MFKGIRNQWNRFADWADMIISRNQTLNKIIEEEDETDKTEIDQANAVIVNHQYLKHMAEARIAARASWRRLQETAHGAGNVTPFLLAEKARSKKL